MAQSLKISYQKSLAELERIIEELQDEKISIDDLPIKLKRAYELIELCQKKIILAETEIKKINDHFSGK
jgi:exodeoxyribonuclease VII small subunit